MSDQFSIKALLDSLNEDLTPQKLATSVWTKEVKQRLFDLGKLNGFSPFATVPGCSEWLFDVTWIKNEGEFIKDTVMLCESEWDLGKYSIDYDFTKLLLPKAELKVMIFNQRTMSAGDGLIQSFKKQIKLYRKSTNGEKYLFSCWVWEDKKFHHVEYTHTSN